MTSPLTVSERIILHLAQYSKYQDDYDVPLDVSQDGIASALRISRAHAAIELKKLKEGEDVDERLAHIRKGKNRRKVYFLTMKGEDKARRIREFAEKEGIDIKPLLDIRRCSGEDLWDSLDEENRKVLARACSFRRPFKRGTLPETSVPLLFEEKDGTVELPRELREQVLTIMDDSSRRECHSLAADYWLGEGDHRERLHHLLMAGRDREAHMLISSRGNELLKIADEDLFTSCEKLGEPPERYRSRVYRFLGELCLRTGHEEECVDIVESLKGFGEEDRLFAMMIEGRLLIQMNDAEGALDVLERARAQANGRDITLEYETSRAMVECGRYDEALDLLQEILPEAARSGEGGKIADIQYLLGVAHLRLGENTDAIKYLSKGMGASREKDLSRWYSSMSEAYRALGMKDKADELHSKISTATRWSSA